MTGVPIRPEIAGPQVGLEMRRIVDGRGLEIVLPAVGGQVRHVDAIGAKTVLAGGAQIAEQALEHGLVPAIRVRQRRGCHRAQQHARIVITVGGDLALRIADAPNDQAESRMLRIGAHTLLRNAAEI